MIIWKKTSDCIDRCKTLTLMEEVDRWLITRKWGMTKEI